MTNELSPGGIALASGHSGNIDASLAAEQASERVAQSLGMPVDLACVFFTAAHVDEAERIGAVVRVVLRPRCLVGVSGESILAGDIESERVPGVAILAARMPNVEIVPFSEREVLPFDGESDTGLGKLAAGLGFAESMRATFVFVDPFSVPLLNLLPAMNRARPVRAAAPILGGVASATTTAGGNRLILNDRVSSEGLVGVTLRGDVRIDPIVSQGCRAVGPNFVVTKARKNMILELSGRPALKMIQDMAASLSEHDQELLQRKGLLLGRVINEYKDRFGRDDYLIRAITGAEETNGAIAVNDFISVGRTVRFHLRDSRTADEDLAMLLDAQKLHGPPAGAMLITCNGRGTRLFDRPHHDASAVVRAFRPPMPASEVAKGGHAISADEHPFALAGFFAAGEIGPVGSENYLHGHTAVAALFRPIA